MKNRRPLASLKPCWTADDDLLFDCPTCPPSEGHVIGVPTRVVYVPDGRLWKIHGESHEFSDLTITPGIKASNGVHCFTTLYITHGMVEW